MAGKTARVIDDLRRLENALVLCEGDGGCRASQLLYVVKDSIKEIEALQKIRTSIRTKLKAAREVAVEYGTRSTGGMVRIDVVDSDDPVVIRRYADCAWAQVAVLERLLK